MTLKTGPMDSKSSGLHHRNKLPFKINVKNKTILNYNNISQYYCICYKNAALVSIRDHLKNTNKIKNKK